ncbi:hypothetical protein JB92DRAFT_2941172 [Gautieria morchelliformis]|nr:hypothetical protein JB92DRAFT_2941172 [Gautieria morchelliformis]
MGTAEEAGAEGFMDIYKTNIYGVVNVTNAFLPNMRDRRSGTVVIVGSRSGWYTHYPVSPYNSSKAAIHGNLVIPGGLRTLALNNCRSISNTSLALPAPGVATGEVPEYAKLRAVANEAFQITTDTLFLGSDALRDVRAKCRAVLETLDEWEDVAISIDVDQ